MTKVVEALPPNYEDIKRSDLRPRLDTVAFTYGDTIYCPGGNELAGHVICHEEVHMGQQKAYGKDKWWKRYLNDLNFRLEQELEAYIAQYAYTLANLPRSDRRFVLAKISRDLGSPMYGGIIDKREAKELIISGVA